MTDDVILNKAATIERCMARIHDEYQDANIDLEKNYTKQDAIILNIQRACKAALDMGTHVVRIKKLGIPQTNREVFEILAINGIIPNDLSLALQKMVGFRNIAVHDYTRLELAIVRKIIEIHLKEVEQFSQLLLRGAF